MTTDDDVLVATIDELVSNFRSALVALIPSAERAKLQWSDVMNQSPSWEGLQQQLFYTFVAQPVSVDRGRVPGEFHLAPYDIDLTDYVSTSWIACRTAAGEELPFTRFVTDGEPFNVVRCVKLSPTTDRVVDRYDIPLAEVSFLYVRRAPDNYTSRIYTVTSVE
jgi:hypothetical protein